MDDYVLKNNYAATISELLAFSCKIMMTNMYIYITSHIGAQKLYSIH